METGRQPSSCSTGWIAIAHRAPGEYIHIHGKYIGSDTEAAAQLCNCLLCIVLHSAAPGYLLLSTHVPPQGPLE